MLAACYCAFMLGLLPTKPHEISLPLSDLVHLVIVLAAGNGNLEKVVFRIEKLYSPFSLFRGEFDDIAQFREPVGPHLFCQFMDWAHRKITVLLEHPAGVRFQFV